MFIPYLSHINLYNLNRKTSTIENDWSDFITHDLILIGIVGIEDPVRPQAPPAVKECQAVRYIINMG